MTHLKTPIIHQDSHSFTVDPKLNNLVGADDIELYKNEDYPFGCVQEYYSTKQCVCCPSEWIDYTLYSKKHLQPSSSYMRSFVAKVDPFDISFRYTLETVNIQDVSDHFPILGTF